MSTPTDFSQLVSKFTDLILAALPVLTGLALLVFLWGIAKFIFHIGGSEDAIKDGKNLMVWGLIALFILLSFLAIIAFVHNDIGFGPFERPFLP